MLKTRTQSAFSLRMFAMAPRATSWPLLARAPCVLRQPPSRFSVAAPSRMKVIRLPLGTAVSAFSRGPENVQGSEKNQPPTADTRIGFGFFLPSQHPTTSIGQPGTFFHVTIFLWGWPVVTIRLVARSGRSFVEAAQNLQSQGSLWKPDPRLVIRYIVRNPFHLDLRMTARYAHLTDTQVQGVIAALDAIFDATRYASSARKSKGFLKLWAKDVSGGPQFLYSVSGSNRNQRPPSSESAGGSAVAPYLIWSANSKFVGATIL